MKYSFLAEIWLWEGQGAWHFLTLPGDISAEIKEAFGTGRPGFGSIRVTATIKDHIWKTSIFPDSKSGSYLLPVKAEIRKKANISAGDQVEVNLDLAI